MSKIDYDEEFTDAQTIDEIVLRRKKFEDCDELVIVTELKDGTINDVTINIKDLKTIDFDFKTESDQ